MLIRILSFLLVLLFSIVRSAPAAETKTGGPGPSTEDNALRQNQQSPIAGLSVEEAMRLGEAMYQKAVLPSGGEMEAIVQGDLTLTGDMVTCSKCHLRAGLGSYEGLVLTLPTNGANLYAPLLEPRQIPAVVGVGEMAFEFQRPAYTDELLAAALRYGYDPAGRPLLDTMPRYILDDRDMEIMIFYLKNLSSKNSPGVTTDEIRFATVVTEGVSLKDRNAMLDPLKAAIQDDWNAHLADLRKGWPDFNYRKLSLDVWELKGPAETWNTQLEALYRQKPVFALLGGISSGTWGPVHQFCEKNRVPCIFPITDLPVVSSDDFYTLYFSKGLYQEGESAAKFLSRTLAVPPETQVLQIYRQDDRSSALAKGFADFWKRTGGTAMKARVLAAGEVTGKEFWKSLVAANKDAALLVWLGPSDLAGIEELGAVENPPTVIVSASMLAASLSSLPDKVRDSTYITYPRRLPGEEAYATSVVESWLKFKKIPVTNMTIESKTYFLSRVLLSVVSSLRGDCYRDYFLDLFDVQEEKTAVVAEFPRVTFGPGQRYASKGCYIVTLTKGPQPKMFRQTEWVNY